MVDYEEGLVAMSRLREREAQQTIAVDRNEAQTRFDLIDALLIECLG